MKTKCTVRYNGSRQTFTILKDTSLLNELRAHKIPVSFSCNGEGICTTCRIILIKGKLSPQTFLEKQRADERGYAQNERLSCQCHPTSNEIEIKVP